MKKYLITGVVLLAIDLAILLFFWEWRMLPAITAITAFPFIFLAGFITGAYKDPDHYHLDIQESSSSRNKKIRFATRILAIALPSFLVCVPSFIFYYW